MASSSVNTKIEFRSGDEGATLDQLEEFIHTCKDTGFPGDTKLQVNAGNNQKDGQWLHLTAARRDDGR